MKTLYHRPLNQYLTDIRISLATSPKLRTVVRRSLMSATDVVVWAARDQVIDDLPDNGLNLRIPWP